jgi:hypothetical protein
MEQTHDTVGPGPGVLSIAAGEPTEDPAPRPVTPWLQATAADVRNRDFEAPVAGSVSAASSTARASHPAFADAAGD